MESISLFWKRYPALLYGVAGILGTSSALGYLSSFIPLILTIFSVIPLIMHPAGSTRLILAVCCFGALFILTKERHKIPETDRTGIEGIAHFKISSVTHSKIPFQKAWSYKGTLQKFIPFSQKNPTEIIAANIPIYMLIPMQGAVASRPKASQHYQLHARLKDSGDNRYSLVPIKNAKWIPLKKSWNLTEWRYKAKNQLSQYIQNHIQDQNVSAFLAGIATGEFNDRLLSFELSRFGLQHLMAISGLHFAIIASILGFIFRLFMSTRSAAMLLILALSAYFLFLGDSPSVLRAWIAIVAGLTALLQEKQNSALNALGIALLFIAIWDPFSARQIGFQFSFAVTASILLWFPVCDVLLQRIFIKRPLSHAVQMSWLTRHACCLLYFLRQALALAVAVNLTALPLTLFYFQKFPLLSLFYNLFFPFLVSLSMLFLLLAMAASIVIAPLGNFLHAINELYTRFVLNFAYNLPNSFDTAIYGPTLSSNALFAYLAVIFTLGILVNSSKSQSPTT